MLYQARGLLRGNMGTVEMQWVPWPLLLPMMQETCIVTAGGLARAWCILCARHTSSNAVDVTCLVM